MKLSLSIDYGGEGVLCFDPEKVVMRFCEWFPTSEVDPTDHAAQEVAGVEAFLDSSHAAAETKKTMQRQIEGKARRNGPVFKFRVKTGSGGILSGTAARYSIRINSEAGLDNTLRERLVEFLMSLRIGTLEIVD